MASKTALMLCFLILLGVLCVQAQRDGRRRSGRRKPTTETPPPVEEPEKEQNPQKLDAEPEAIAKPSSAQPIESETNAPQGNANQGSQDQGNANQGGPPFIVPRGTRKPRPHVRNSGESRPRPTLPSFARKRGPKSERRDFKRTDENSVVSSTSSTTTTTRPSRGDTSRSRGSQSPDRNTNAERNTDVNDEVATETAPKKRFGGNNRRQSRGNRRHNAEQTES